jgi:hypothetical protein
MVTELFSSGFVANELQIPRWWLLYRIERGDVPGPSVNVPGRRLFTRQDIAEIGAAIERGQFRERTRRPGGTRECGSRGRRLGAGHGYLPGTAL